MAGLAVLGGIAVWRLSSEPVRLDFLTPYLEQAVDLEDRGLAVEVGETLLLWQGWSRTIDLRARRILIRDREGSQLAWLPDVSVTLSLRALLQGTVAPTYIEVIGPELVMERSTEGRISIGTARPDDAAPAETSALDGHAGLRRLLDGLLIEPDPGRNLSYLSAIRVSDGRLTLRDRGLAQAFAADDLTLELRREAPGIGGELSLRLALPEQPARLEAAFTYDRASGGIELASSVSGLWPSALPGEWPGAEIVRGLKLPLGGSLTLSLNETGGLDAATFDITGAAGVLDLGERLPVPRPVKALRLSGAFDGPGGRLTVQTADLDFAPVDESADPDAAGASIELSGEAALAEEEIALQARARVAGLPANDFAAFWPSGLKDNARSWIVENIRDGVVEETQAEIALRLPLGEGGGETRLERFQGSMRYRDLAIHYLRPMPPVTAVSGTATFDPGAIRFAIESGRNGTIELGESEAVIEGFDEPGPETMSVAFPASGPLGDALTLLNHERIRLIDKLGLDPATTRGSARCRVAFNFPLLDVLPFDKIAVSTTAQLADVEIGALLLGQDATEGRLGLALNSDNMRVNGDLRLGGVPIEIDWREAFGKEVEPRSHYEVLVPSMGDAGRERFGFDVLDGLSGPVSASVIADTRHDGSTSIQTALNLQQATLELPDILWAKPAGAPGTASFTLRLDGSRLVGLDKLEVEAGDLVLSGSGRFDERGSDLASLHFDNLWFARNELTDVTLLRQGLGRELRIGGGDLDAAPFVESGRSDAAATDPAAAARRPPLRLRAEDLDAVRFGEGRYLEHVTFDLERIGDAWNRIQLVSQVPRTLWRRNAQLASVGTQSGEAGEARTLRVDYHPDGDARHVLELESNDAGAALRALDLLDTMEGGTLRITGQALPDQPLMASLEMEDFTMIDAPVLGRLLLVASLTGIVEGLSSDGIFFDRMVGDFSMIGGVITTELMRAYGGSLGLTTKGTLDYTRSEYDLAGTIVPAYGINRILNEIPLIGTILTGGEGEGLVAFTYEMTGPFDEPRISVNPLSALTPGWLRGIFSGSGKGEEPTVFPDGGNK